MEPLFPTAPTFAWVNLPTGPQPLPGWLKGLHIDWMEGWSNSPRVFLKTAIEARAWPDKVFRKSGARYLAESGDGRAEQYIHDGALSWDEATGVWRTTQQNGFYGDTIPIVLTDGRAVHLRGPWHGLPPTGFVEISYVDVSSPYYACAQRTGRSQRTGRPWYRLTAVGGLLLSEDLFLRAVARFAPACRVARLADRGGLEPVHADWDAPKACRYD